MSKNENKNFNLNIFGSIPLSWKFIRLKDISERIETGSTPPTSVFEYYEDGTIPWYGPSSFDDTMYLKKPVKLINGIAVQNGDLKVFKSETLLFVGIGATIGKVALLEGAGACNQQINIITLNKYKVNPVYVYYVLKCYQGIIIDIAQFTTLPIFNQVKTGNLPIPLPSKKEQTAIVDYLNKACAEIDKVVDLKERQIDVISSLFKSDKSELLINTKWKKYKVRYITQMRNGDAIRNEELNENGEIPVYGGNGIIGYTNNFNVDGETIVIGRVGAKCGNVHLVKGRAWISDNAISVKTEFNYEFLGLVLREMNLNSLSSETAQPLLTAENVKKQYVFLPIRDEQNVVFEKYKLLENNFIDAVNNLKQQIATLKEFKKSLIQEAVAGKKQELLQGEEYKSLNTNVELIA